jgi:hypothetical protein
MSDTTIDPYFHAAASELQDALSGVLTAWAKQPELIEPTAAALDSDGYSVEAARLRGFAEQGPKVRDALAATVEKLTDAADRE